MYYLINNDSQLSLADQIARCDTTFDREAAIRIAQYRKDDTGDDWEVVEIRSVYTTQTLDDAHRKALDFPHMARD